jgi:hypothetical protein
MNTAAIPPAPPPVVEPVLGEAWQLFRRHWAVFVAPSLIGLVAMLVGMGVLVPLTIVPVALRGGFAAHTSSPLADQAAVATMLFMFFAIALVAIPVWLWTIAGLFGIADAIATRGSATLRDATRAFGRCWLALIAAGIGVFGLAVVALILVIPTVMLSLLALAVFVMYVPAAIVSGGYGGFGAIRESFRIVRLRFGASLLAFVLLVAIHYGMSLLTVPFVFPLQAYVLTLDTAHPVVPPLAPLLAFGAAFVLVSMVVVAAYYALYALILTLLYRRLTTMPAPDVAASVPPVAADGEPA